MTIFSFETNLNFGMFLITYLKRVDTLAIFIKSVPQIHFIYFINYISFKSLVIKKLNIKSKNCIVNHGVKVTKFFAAFRYETILKLKNELSL